MLCEWRVRKKGQEANPYEDYRDFPSVFCLKINHGGKFTSPPMIRYKGGMVNWVDDIDSDIFSIVEVTKNLSELDNGLIELAVDKDVCEMLMYVDKFKVIELYTNHSVNKKHVFIQEPLTTTSEPNEPDIGSGSEAEVDVSEDEWLKEALKKLPIKSKKGQQPIRKEVGQLSRNGSGSKNGSGSDPGSGSDSEDSDYFVDEENLIDDVDVDMLASSQLVKEKVTKVSVEQRRQLWLKNDKLRVRVVCRGQVPDFSNNNMGSVLPITSDPKGTTMSKLPNEDTWEVKTLEDTHKCLQSRIVNKCTTTFLSMEVEESIKPNPKIPLNALKDQLQKKFEVGVSKQKVFRAKKMAYERVVATLLQRNLAIHFIKFINL
ncbi:hypothetical protein Tco_1162202 [Tanacetum coccineum]